MAGNLIVLDCFIFEQVGVFHRKSIGLCSELSKNSPKTSEKDGQGEEKERRGVELNA